MRRHAFPQQRHQLRAEEFVVVFDVQRHDPADGAVMGKPVRERAALVVVHDEYDVSPVQHALVDPDERVWAGPRRSHVQSGIFAEDAFGRRAALPVVVADEENPNRTVRWSAHEFG